MAELRSALVRLGFPLPAATTLLALERRLARTVGPVSARYAAALRPTATTRPRRTHPASPIAARCAGSSPRAADRSRRLRGLRAIPPAGPRPL